MEFLKIIHFLALAVGFGGGVANLVAMSVLFKTDPPQRAPIGMITKRVGQILFLCVILLWITGIGLVHGIYGGFSALPDLFWWKFLFVCLATLASLSAQIVGIRAAKAGTPPNAKLMVKIGVTASLSAIAAIVLAVLAF